MYALSPPFSFTGCVFSPRARELPVECGMKRGSQMASRAFNVLLLWCALFDRVSVCVCFHLSRQPLSKLSHKILCMNHLRMFSVPHCLNLLTIQNVSF